MATKFKFNCTSIPLMVLDDVLSHDQINAVAVAHDHTGFSRQREFQVFDETYKITWHTNKCVLHINDIEIYFTDLYVTGSAPNNYKTSIHFINGDTVVCILPIEKYKEPLHD